MSAISINARARFDNARVRDAMTRGIGAGLSAAGLVVLEAVRLKLNRRGNPPARKSGKRGQRPLLRKIALGESLIEGAGSSAFSKAQLAAVRLAVRIRAQGGLIDPPGGVPRKRSGVLQRSMIAEKAAPDTVRVGSTMPFKVAYAAIHEFGGIVNGKPFPARPFLRPAFVESAPKAEGAFWTAMKNTLERALS